MGVDCAVESAASTDFSVGSAVGGIVAALVIIAVVIVIIVFVRRRKLNTKDQTGRRSVPEKTENILEKAHGAADGPIYVNVEPSARNSTENLDIDETNVSDVVPVVDRGEPAGEQTDDEEEEVQDSNTYYNADQPAPPPSNLPEEGFDVSELEGIIENIRRQPGGFEAEYLKLPSGFKHPYTDSQIQENRCKNRFAGYYPYNNNRVKLSLLPTIPHSDYINASYVDV
ncbi:receptor-type tyrosine-protein phosphatase T-like, partial [Gigantopelta aegis]|uniref:receptor-type tyrosine-protein phosphatase T-like n=1 Tax=Gigantopelta aegis TaxID=1735272 RepID=UPI001B889E24